MRSTEEFFSRNPVFTLDAFVAAGAPTRSARVAYRHLGYFVRVGRLKRVRNGLYAVVPADSAPHAYTPDPYLVAWAVGRGAPLGYHTALELLGVGHSAFRTKMVITARRTAAFAFDGHRVEFAPPPPRLRAQGRVDQGVTTLRYLSAELKITGRERTLVDCLLHPARAGGLEEVLNSVNGFGVFDLPALMEYLPALGSRRAWAITGYYLEKRMDHLFVSEKVLGQLAEERPKSRQYWLPGQRGGRLAPRWTLIVPEVVGEILG